MLVVLRIFSIIKYLIQKEHDEENQETTENNEQSSPKTTNPDENKSKHTDVSYLFIHKKKHFFLLTTQNNKTGRSGRKSETELLLEEAVEVKLNLFYVFLL